jgi:hypothetical protein
MSAPSCWFPRRSVLALAIHLASTSTTPAQHCVRPVATIKLGRMDRSRGLHLLFGEPCRLDLHFSILASKTGIGDVCLHNHQSKNIK